MRIVSWNCNGAFRKKYSRITDLSADLYIIQECEDPSKTKLAEYEAFAENSLWIGENTNKGLGVFSNPSLKIKRLNWDPEHLKYFLPFTIEGGQKILAAWCHQANSPTFQYIGQFWKYLQMHRSNLRGALIAGDFNSNVRWDKWDRWWNHSDIIRELEEIGTKSIYHQIRKEAQGSESIPTLFHRKSAEKSYHIDYMFAPLDQMERVQTFTIGSRADWIDISDHVPLILDIHL